MEYLRGDCLKNKVIQTRVSLKLQQESNAVLQSVGLSQSEAIRLFLQQCVNHGGLPFQPVMRVPNADTIKAIEEFESKKESLPSYDSFTELLDKNNLDGE